MNMMLTITLQGAGLGLVFVPLQVVAFYTMTAELRTQGTSMLSLARNVGSAIGISITTSLLSHQAQYVHANLAQFITPFARPLQAGGAVSRMLNPATPAGASLLNSIINTQAQIIGYIDDYKFMLIAIIPAMACLLLMKKPPTLPKITGHAVID